MSILPPDSALLDGRTGDDARAVQRTFLWLTGSLATAAGILGLTALLASQNEREAGRMIIAAQQGTGYVTSVIAAYTASQGRPNRY